MHTLYDVLGVPRNASDDRIRAAFRKAAKLYHPDLNAGDPTAEQQLRQALAAYEMLKNPQKRMAYDQYLRTCRRESVRSFAMTAVAGLVSGSLVVALVVTLLRSQDASGSPQAPGVVAASVIAPTSQQVAADDRGSRPDADRGGKGDRVIPPNRSLPDERHLQQVVSSMQPMAGHPGARRTPTAKERGQAQASSDSVQAFADRGPAPPESEAARSKLMALIDTADDVSLLNVLRLGGTGAIAERAQQRLIRLGALGKQDQTASHAPSTNSIEGRAASFVAARVAAWSSAKGASFADLAGAYADKVNYYGKLKSREAVLLEKRSLLEQWPERVYNVQPGSIAVQCRANVCKVSGTMVWQARSVPRATSASGIAPFEYEVSLSRGAFKILSESSPIVQVQEDGSSETRQRRGSLTSKAAFAEARPTARHSCKRQHGALLATCIELKKTAAGKRMLRPSSTAGRKLQPEPREKQAFVWGHLI